ncbi:TPA: iron-containing alcohol dehydrogenase [Candidatus Poribacteria bacterium]|nr:iron-containing alcohol dehydrogenase [Candidatus Poribacteria bacterium]
MFSGMFELRYPSRLIFGNGCFDRLGEVAAEFGRKALLVTGRRAMRESGTLDKALKLLRESNVKTAIFDKVEPEPSTDTVDEGVRIAKEQGCDLVVGIGGGSAMDAAKAIACLVRNEGSASEHQRGIRRIEREGLPFIAVPTTAGTGAEVTKNAVLIDKSRNVKASIRSPLMLAKVALVDPLLTLSAPPRVTAGSGMDALTQAIESYVSLASNPISDALAIRAISYIYDFLPRAFESGDDVEAREKVMLGSFMTGLSFANASLGAVHGLAHPIGAHFGVPHGIACAILLPHVMRFNLDVRREKYAEIAAAMGAEPDPETSIEKVEELMARLDLPRGLSHFGVKEEELEKVAGDAGGSSLNNNPNPTTKEDLIEILRNAL